MSEASSEPPRPPRRKRYGGKNPRTWDLKYKEHRGDAETLAKVVSGGKTAAGTHRPIMMQEILEILNPQLGQVALDCTLGYGGHAEELLSRLLPGGRLIGLDADPIQLPLTAARLQGRGFGADSLLAARSNFAGAAKILAKEGLAGVDILLADLGVSSMQIDNPARGFTFKQNGPLDMRMNPQRGQPASEWLRSVSVEKLQRVLEENSDEPKAAFLARELAGADFPNTLDLARRITQLSHAIEVDDTLRRVFQALRIEVNEEFNALDSLLRQLPSLLHAGGCAAILTFHSGEDRRVKKSFLSGFQEGWYAEISSEVLRPSGREIFHNPRSSSAKLRWARKGGAQKLRALDLA